MHTVRRPWTAVAVLLAAVVTVAHGARPAGRNVNHEEALHLRQAGTILPFAVILDSAMSRYRGSRLLQTELQRDDDALIYDMELLTADGRVRTLYIDARSGRILDDEDERDH